MTVSNVVNGRGSVAEETRSRVLAAVERLGYRPQQHARGLRLSRSWVVGLLFVMHKRDLLTSPWMGEMISGLSNTLSDSGYGLLMDTQHAETVDRSVLLRWHNTDGIVAMLSGSEAERGSLWQRLLATRQPLVGIQETLVASKDDFASVRQNDAQAATEIVDVLLRQGARRIRFIEPDYSWPNMSQRIMACRQRLDAVEGVEFDVIRCPSDSYQAIDAEIRKDLMRKGVPDAYMAGNEAISLSTLGVLEASGLQVPRDVMLTAFNAFEHWHFARQAVTTVSFPAEQIGMRAARLMLDRLDGGEFTQKSVVFPGRLIEGETTRR